MLPVSSFKDSAWGSIGDDLWPIVAKLLGAQRLARQVCFVSINVAAKPFSVNNLYPYNVMSILKYYFQIFFWNLKDASGTNFLFCRAKLHQLELGTVPWRFSWEIMAGLNIEKMEFFTHLIQLNACFLGEIYPRSLGWPVLTVKMKLLSTYLQALDILCCHFLSGMLLFS